PKRLVGQMMGTWFMGTALGNLIAGLAAGEFQGMGVAELFSSVAKVTGAAGVVLLLFSRTLRRLMGGEEETPALLEVPVSPETPAHGEAVP
ncbi:MAG TPA: hypothetical protein VEO37_07180, partial [Thermoanaerobaculia bacterium]|nr:hypothetical protein [Thermoanaerobaculia bacterium]